MNASYVSEAKRAVEARPDPTPEQWAAFERVVKERAPDLVEMLGVGLC